MTRVGLAALTIVSVLGVLLLLPSQASAAGWTKQYYQTYGLLDIQFVDAQHGWAVGGNGSIVATTNGGAAWTAQTSGTTELLQAVDFVDAQCGWAVGYNGTILATGNGGATWTAQTSTTTNHLYGVSFVDRTQGWACGYNGAILQTTNGGGTWTRITWPFGQNAYTFDLFHDIAMADGSHGFCAGEDVIARALTGTPPWAYTIPNYLKDSYQAVDCASATAAVVVGGTTANPASEGVAYITGDGTTWTQLTGAPATTEWYNDVSMPSAGAIYLSGSDSSVWASTDAGATWTSLGKVEGGYASLDFLDSSHGWVVCGPGGSIYSYGSAAAKPVPKALANVSVKKGTTATLPYRVDCAAATCKATIKILRKGKTVKTFTIAKVKTKAKVTKRFKCTLAKGSYTWSVSAVAGGVKSAKASSKKLTVK